MNLNKHKEFFDPEEFEDEIHIIGCGAIGSTIAEHFARLGIKSLHIYDFDTVTEHNITNQMYTNKHVGLPKVDALTDILCDINPEITITTIPEGWQEGTTLSGYVYLAVDDIELRQKIVKENLFNPNIKAMFDTRMRLTDAQHFACIWNEKGQKHLLATMNFTKEEALEATPISACGTTLSVTPTVRMICALAVANFINVVKEKPINKTVIIDAFDMTVDAFTDKE